MVLRRRSFLAQIAAGGVAALNLTRQLLAQAFELRYLPLAQPVVVPLETVDAPIRQFVANGATIASAASPNQP